MPSGLALIARPIDIAPWLFCTKRGKSYFNEETGQATGRDSIWQRFMSRLLAETKVIQRPSSGGTDNGTALWLHAVSGIWWLLGARVLPQVAKQPSSARVPSPVIRDRIPHRIQFGSRRTSNKNL